MRFNTASFCIKTVKEQSLEERFQSKIAIALSLVVPVQREIRTAVLPVLSAISIILKGVGIPLTFEEITLVPETMILNSLGQILLPLSDKKVIAPRMSTAPTLFKCVKIGAVAVFVPPDA